MSLERATADYIKLSDYCPFGEFNRYSAYSLALRSCYNTLSQAERGSSLPRKNPSIKMRNLSIMWCSFEDLQNPQYHPKGNINVFIPKGLRTGEYIICFKFDHCILREESSKLRIEDRGFEDFLFPCV
jgi:hypothetical protein